MPDEKANKAFHWRNRLEQLDGIPGEAPVDQAAAWQRLHDRLQKKPVHRKTAWYRIAAACLFFVLALSWLVLVQPVTSLVKDTKPRQDTSSKSFRALQGRDVAAVSTQHAAQKKSISPVLAKSKVHAALVNVAVTSLPALPDADTLKEISAPLVIHQAVDTILLTAAVPKKKLRVVHINELNNTVEDMHLASNAPPSSTKFLHADDLSGFSVSRNASDNIVKIKLSSSN